LRTILVPHRKGPGSRAAEVDGLFFNHHNQEGWCIMAGKIEKSKGKAKEAVGSLTGNKKLESEGKIDRRAGAAKEKVGRVKGKVEGVAEKAERKAVKAIDKAKGATRRK
jgi:uncharacterized protein YjbJ (UPF0337 family)